MTTRDTFIDRSEILRNAKPRIGKFFRNLIPSIRLAREQVVLTQQLLDLALLRENGELQSKRKNPLNNYGRKCFSQTDEDGLTIEILKRINHLGNGVYAEFGVGDGMENNTLILASLGWRGFWVGGEDLAFTYAPNKKFTFLREWITLDNILELTKRGLDHLQVSELDVVSLDLDGNDIFLAEKLLSNKVKPKLFIVEYNAKFPPPVEFQITYDAQHTWKGDDYYGASLSSFNKMFSSHGYRLICCNSATGVNAFFIRSDYEKEFSDVPTEIDDLYVEPRFYMYHRYGHPSSVRVVEKILGVAEKDGKSQN